MATRGFSRTDGKATGSPFEGILAAWRWSSGGDARGAAAVLSADRSRRMAAADSNRRRDSRHCVRAVPVHRPAASASAGADTTDTAGAVVLWRGHRTWRRTDAVADL